MHGGVIDRVLGDYENLSIIHISRLIIKKGNIGSRDLSDILHLAAKFQRQDRSV